MLPIILHNRMKNSFVPAKPVSYDTNTKGAHHAAHTEDGNSNAPDNGANTRVDFLVISLIPGYVEERFEFLSAKMDAQTEDEKTDQFTELARQKNRQNIIVFGILCVQ